MASDREHFTPSELAVVLSHYDLGVIDNASEFARGSRKSPKLLLHTARGNYLLKRRAQGRDDPGRVAFAHTLLAHLRRHAFPVPAVVLTRDGHHSMLQVAEHVYELFEYVAGESYDGSLEATTRAGITLGRFHRAVRDFQTEWEPPQGSYHDSPAVRAGLQAIPGASAAHESVFGHEAELLAALQELYEEYDEAAAAANRCGQAGWSMRIIHGDWHPGNMLFRDGHVVVVLDFDAARRQPRVLDVANGMLQFSILRGGGDPARWPTFFDETRMRRFLLGYLAERQLAAAPRRAIPALMIEALIAEAVVPIAATGSFGPLPGFNVLLMVRRKVRWLRENFDRLQRWLLA